MPPDKGNVKKSLTVKQETNIQVKSTTTKRDLKETSGKSTLTIKSIYGSHSTTDSKTKTLSVLKTKEQPQKDDPESKLEPQKEMLEKKRNLAVQKSRQALGKVKSETGKGKLSSQDVKNAVTTSSHTLVKNVVKTMPNHIPAKNTDSGDTLTHRSKLSHRTTTQGTPEKVRTKVKKENTASSTKPQPKDRSRYQTWRDTGATIPKTKDTNIKLKTTAGKVKTLSTELKNKITNKESRKHRNNPVDKESRNKEVYKESRNKFGDKYSRTKPVDKERQNKPLDKNEPTSKLDNTTPEVGTKKLHRERTRTRTLSPTEVKMAQSIQAEIEKEQQMKKEKSKSSTDPSPSRTMDDDTSKTDDEEGISDSVDKDDYDR
uniref:Uncharacterized protein n=1 Tax=Timema cristinae TaxID=61476 RepID=A0A7R9CII5_TIMCR|nr:unnamed protein product [Timema cristinae]